MIQDEAQQQYIALVDSLVAAEGGSAAEAAPSASTSGTAGLDVDIRDGILVLTLNNPSKKNPFAREVSSALNHLAASISFFNEVFLGS